MKPLEKRLQAIEAARQQEANSPSEIWFVSPDDEERVLMRYRPSAMLAFVIANSPELIEDTANDGPVMAAGAFTRDIRADESETEFLRRVQASGDPGPHQIRRHPWRDPSPPAYSQPPASVLAVLEHFARSNP